jgi:hypothetical protein
MASVSDAGDALLSPAGELLGGAVPAALLPVLPSA